MTAARYVFWLTVNMSLSFWAFSPWKFIVRLAMMPAALTTLLALDPEVRLESIKAGVAYLGEARAKGEIWICGFVWRRIQNVV